MRKIWDNFDGRLWLNSAADGNPDGTLRRARGLGLTHTRSARSRNGSALLQSLDAHSVVYYGDVLFAGVSEAFYRAGVSIKSGLSGERLSFAKMPPKPGQRDYLFVAGGGELFKVGPSGAVSEWGIAAPTSDPTAEALPQLSATISDCDTIGDWTVVGATCTVTAETTLLVEGTGSIKFYIPDAKSGYIYDNIELDLTQFDTGQESSCADYITFWIYIDEPQNLAEFELLFSLDDTNFNKTFSRHFDIMSDIEQDSTNVGALGKGVASLSDYEDESLQRLWLSRYQTDEYEYYVSEQRTRDLLADTQKATIDSNARAVWRRIAIHKSMFALGGTEDRSECGWADVKAIRFAARADGGAVNVYIDDIKMVGGYGIQGTYKYLVTYYNSTTGVRSNPNATPAIVSNVERQAINVLNVPVSPDPQVNRREIWRTLGDGTLYFKVGEIANNSDVVYTDVAADFYILDIRDDAIYLSDTELPFDNLKPYDYFDDCAAYNASMFWITRTEAGETHRLFYSPVGRPESLEGFLNLTGLGDTCQRVVAYNGRLYVFTEAKLFEVAGTNPYSFREIAGAPGTTKPHTVAVTPYGIAYEADDGVRVMMGSQSVLAAGDAISALFRGRSSENLDAFGGVVGAYARGEYIISDLSQTLAFEFTHKTWRDLGVGCKALTYDADDDVLAASIGGNVLALDAEGSTDDNGTDIAFEIETPHWVLDGGNFALAKIIRVDGNAAGGVLTVSAICDGEAIALGALTAPARKLVAFPLHRPCARLGVRIAGDIDAQVEINRIELEYTQRRRTDV